MIYEGLWEVCGVMLTVRTHSLRGIGLSFYRK